MACGEKGKSKKDKAFHSILEYNEMQNRSTYYLKSE